MTNKAPRAARRTSGPQPLRPFRDFYRAWRFLEDHPMFAVGESSMLHHCLEIEVVKVNPRTRSISDDPRKNTATRVWFECGPWLKPEDLSPDERKHLPHGIASVDLQLACGAPTFERAIVKLANLVARRYGKSRHPQRRIRPLTELERDLRQARREHATGKSRPAEELLRELREQAQRRQRKKPSVSRNAPEQRLRRLQRYGAQQAKHLGLTEADVPRLIREYREESRSPQRRSRQQ